MASRVRFGRSKKRQRLTVVLGSIGLTVLLSLAMSLASGSLDRAMAAPAEQPELINVVFDGAEIFGPEQEQQINLAAKDILESYGVAMAVETVDTIDGRSIDEWTTDRANERRVGSDELNNGLFYGIAYDDREFHVEKGNDYAAIPDADLELILDEQMTPRFRDGDFAGGVTESAKYFGALAIGEPLSATSAEKQAADAETMGKIGSAFGWILGGLAAGAALIGGSIGIFKLVISRREAKELAAKREREAQKLRLKQEAKRKLIAAFDSLDSDDWKVFAKLPDGESRRQMLLSAGVYSAAFGTLPESMPTQPEIRLMDRTIAAQKFACSDFKEHRSVRQAEKSFAEQQERSRRQRAEEAEERRRNDALKRNAKSFWQGLSAAEKREYSKLNSDSDRQRWVSTRGGSNLFGFHPAIAFAMFAALSSDHSRAAASYSGSGGSNGSSSTDYRSSSYTDYSSSNTFGGGSFGDGGGVSGNW